MNNGISGISGFSSSMVGKVGYSDFTLLVEGKGNGIIIGGEKLSNKEILERTQKLFDDYCKCGSEDKKSIEALLKEAKILFQYGDCVLMYAKDLFLNIAILGGNLDFYQELRQAGNLLTSESSYEQSAFKNLLECGNKDFIVAVIKYELGLGESVEEFKKLMPEIKCINTKDDEQIGLLVEYRIAIENKDLSAFHEIWNRSDNHEFYLDNLGKKVFYYFTGDGDNEELHAYKEYNLGSVWRTITNKNKEDFYYQNEEGETVFYCSWEKVTKEDSDEDFSYTSEEFKSRVVWNAIKDSLKNEMLQHADKLWMYLCTIEPALFSASKNDVGINSSELLRDNEKFQDLCYECLFVPGAWELLFQVVLRVIKIAGAKLKHFEDFFSTILSMRNLDGKTILDDNANRKAFLKLLEAVIPELVKISGAKVADFEQLFSTILSAKDSEGKTILGDNANREVFLKLLKAVMPGMLKMKGATVKDFEDFFSTILSVKNSQGPTILDDNANRKAFLKLLEGVMPGMLKIEGATVADFEQLFSTILSVKNSHGKNILNYTDSIDKFLELLEVVMPGMLKIKGATVADFEQLFSTILSAKDSGGENILDYNSEAFLKMLEAVMPGMLKIEGATVADFGQFFSTILSAKDAWGKAILDCVWFTEVFLKMLEAVMPELVKIEGATVKDFEDFFSKILSVKTGRGNMILSYNDDREAFLKILKAVMPGILKIEGAKVGDFEQLFSTILSVKNSGGMTILDYDREAFLKMLEAVMPGMLKIEGATVADFGQFFSTILSIEDSDGNTILEYNDDREGFLKLLEGVMPVMLKMEGATVKDVEQLLSMILSVKNSKGYTILDYSSYEKYVPRIIQKIVQMHKTKQLGEEYCKTLARLFLKKGYTIALDDDLKQIGFSNLQIFDFEWQSSDKVKFLLELTVFVAICMAIYFALQLYKERRY